MSQSWSEKSPEQILADIQALAANCERPNGPTELTVLRSDMLPPGTILASPDVFEMFKTIPTKEVQS